MIKECLKCKKNFEAVRDSAKFCGTSCRVMYNRKNTNPSKLTKPQSDVLLNIVLEKLSRVNFIPFIPTQDVSCYGSDSKKPILDECPMFPPPSEIRKSKEWFQKRIMQGFETPEEHMNFIDDVNSSELSDAVKRELIAASRIPQS